MTELEFKLIDALNIEGIENHLWGLCRYEVEASMYDPKFSGELPPHIYVYGDDEEMYSYELEDLLMNKYDKKLYYEENRYIAFFWIEV